MTRDLEPTPWRQQLRKVSRKRRLNLLESMRVVQRRHAHGTLSSDEDHIMEEIQSTGSAPHTDAIEIDDSDDQDSATEELDCMLQDYTRLVYAFFKPVPAIKVVDGKRCHEFECGLKFCKRKTRFVRRFLHTTDKTSTGNLRRHAKKCWGEDVIEEADKAANADKVRQAVAGKQDLRSGDIAAAFGRQGKGKVTFSHRQHTKAEARAEYVRWVSKSLGPFEIVKDRAFISLMKTGRPETYIPSPSTISRDVRHVFAKTRARVAKLLQVEVLHARLAGDVVDDEDDDLEDWKDEHETLTAFERSELEENTRPIKLVLVKISYALINSTTILLPRWHELLESLKLSIRKMLRDVKTRWNSTYEMLLFALEYRKAVDTMAGDKENGLRKYELDEREWQLAEQLCDVLAIFKDATLFFSRNTPNLATVIPAMDHIDQVMTTASLNHKKFEPAIRAALSLAKKKLNRYYDMTNQSEVYRIAMVLHRLFKAMNWEEDWITTAEGVDTSKKSKPAKSNIFDNLPALAASKSQAPLDELAAYLSTPVENVVDALKWWVSKRGIWPNLSTMALDYLSIPATSTDVERVFSRGRILLSHTRNRLSPHTTRALMCLGGWSLLGLVRDSDIKAVTTLADVDKDKDEAPEDWEGFLSAVTGISSQ
ncbi:hypothetical protein D9615_004201 [Tricholomella constricta]|uniref:HAT C-terminal dimerisation domain-containing protein n=1 Tax=Tricholomella constricta TaxID=117010 RepID=A0A8H5HEY2_9AGAR|nr:hypothetical protein D9615_004201 [Tricholomella constricta]